MSDFKRNKFYSNLFIVISPLETCDNRLSNTHSCFIRIKDKIIIALWSEVYIKHLYVLCEQIAEFLVLKHVVIISTMFLVFKYVAVMCQPTWYNSYSIYMHTNAIKFILFSPVIFMPQNSYSPSWYLSLKLYPKSRLPWYYSFPNFYSNLPDADKPVLTHLHSQNSTWCQTCIHVIDVVRKQNSNT